MVDYNVSSGPLLSYEIEIGDGPGPELDKMNSNMETANIFTRSRIKAR